MKRYHKNTPISKMNGFINKFIRSDNVSGVPGVSYNRNRKVWSVRLNYNRKVYYGGQFKAKITAIKSRLKLEFKILGIDKMPNYDLIPMYFINPKSKILVAYNEFKKEDK